MIIKNFIRLSCIALIFCISAQAQTQDKKVSAEEKNRIYSEELFPLISQENTLDWNDIERQFEKKYGDVGLELVSKAKVFFYTRTKDWKEHVCEYVAIHPQIRDGRNDP